MADYRMVCRHVRYWRGQVHKWSTVYPFTGTITAGNWAAAIAALYAAEQAVCYSPTASVSGGLYEIALYDSSSGGVPLTITTYFPWASPGAWINYTSTAWASHTGNCNTNAEAALQVEWPGGFSTSGKPVSFKKWYHAIPESAALAGAADVATPDAASIGSALHTGLSTISGLGLALGRGSRLAASTPVVRVYFGNHQMPRGRRRKALVTAAGRYTGPSLLIGPASAGEAGD